MDRSIPVSNKLISKKIHDRHMQIHQAKLQNMKSSISRQAPQTFSHLASNKKKIQVHEDKLTEMERQNRILLDKLTHIMKNNNNNGKHINGPKSLNRDIRKRELVKITIENQALLKRLQDQKSTYDKNLWENDRKKHDIYLKNICEYPFSLINTSKTPGPNEQRPSTFNLTKEDSFSLNHGSPNHKFHMTSKNFQPPKKQISTKLDPVTPSGGQKEILYQSKKKIGFSNYLIHIYVHNNVFTIIASNNDRSDFKSFTMPAKDSLELLRQFGNNFDELVSHIKFKGSKIVFDNISFTTDLHNSKDVPNYTNESTTQIAEVHNENEHDHEATISKDSREEIEQATHNHQEVLDEPAGESQKSNSNNQIKDAPVAEVENNSNEQQEEEEEERQEKVEEQAVENVEEEAGDAGEESGNNQHIVPQEKEQQELKESIVEGDDTKRFQESAIPEDKEVVSDEVEDNNENYKEEFEGEQSQNCVCLG